MIPMRRYVDITSGVGGGAGVRLRDLISRMFSLNELVPPGKQLEFADADAVGSYFGTASEEYKRAAFYFGFVSKNVTKPNKISVARWCKTAVAPKVFGNKTLKNLAAYTAVAAGALTLNLGSGLQTTGVINLAAAVSLADVAAIVQTAVRAVVAGGVAWTAATVSYDALTNRFSIVSGNPAGAASMAVGVPGTGTNLAPLLGWTAASGAILNDGSGVQTIPEVLAQTTEASNNFASFLFLPVLTADEAVAAAQWTDTQNNMFMFLHRVQATDAATLAAALTGISGVALTLAPLATEYPEMLPGVVMAATDYTRRNSVQNYMYQMATLSPSVQTAAEADAYDALRVNYYGRTQAAGQAIDFYQRGVLMGLASDAVDMNVYANEIWLKDAAGAEILKLLLALGKVSANLTGRSQLIAALATVVAQGLTNGTVSAGKALNITQKLYVSQLTGDELAWRQVQNLGYWLDCVMQPYVTGDGRTEWKAVYTLIYSKDDTIRKVEGSHVMI